MTRFAACGLMAAAVSLAFGAGVTIPIEQYQLKNGLRVILSKDNAVPVVTVYLIYNVGARSEEKGRTGFAHLFEHMMFECSANAPKGTHFAAVESNVGGLRGPNPPSFTVFSHDLSAHFAAPL